MKLELTDRHARIILLCLGSQAIILQQTLTLWGGFLTAIGYDAAVAELKDIQDIMEYIKEQLLRE